MAYSNKKTRASNVCFRYLYVVVMSCVGVLLVFVTFSAYMVVGLHLS